MEFTVTCALRPAWCVRLVSGRCDVVESHKQQLATSGHTFALQTFDDIGAYLQIVHRPNIRLNIA